MSQPLNWGGVLYTTYFECKKYAPDRPVGVNVVRELYAVMERERVDKGVIVTTSHFTRGAVQEAQMLNGSQPKGQAPLTKCEQKFGWCRKMSNLVKRNWLHSLSETGRIQM